MNVAQMDGFSSRLKWWIELSFLGKGVMSNGKYRFKHNCFSLESVDNKKEFKIYLNSTRRICLCPGVRYLWYMHTLRQTLLQFCTRKRCFPIGSKFLLCAGAEGKRTKRLPQHSRKWWHFPPTAWVERKRSRQLIMENCVERGAWRWKKGSL